MRVPFVSLHIVHVYSPSDPETLSFQVVHLSRELVSNAEQKKGSWIKDAGAKLPHQTTNTAPSWRGPSQVCGTGAE